MYKVLPYCRIFGKQAIPELLQKLGLALKGLREGRVALIGLERLQELVGCPGLLHVSDQ